MKKISVLLIEENIDLRKSVIDCLTSDGFDIHTAEDGPSAIQIASECDPQVILLDTNEGLGQLVAELKLNRHTQKIPTIILTEADPLEGVRQASEICADGHIAKPFEKEKLGELVRFKLENYRAVMGKSPRREKRIPVLVIDDEEDIRKLVKFNLYHAGFEVYTAVDGPSGIKAARKYKPHLILLDVMMPGMNGLEVLLNLKWHKKTKNIPVFMLTAKSTLEDIDHAYARRADDYIAKPFDSKKLRAMVKQKLEKPQRLKR